MANKRQKTEIITQNLKLFNKTIDSFNKRIKKAYDEGNISDSSYKTIIIDKDLKDFYKSNIYTKKQFNDFIKELDKANETTLKPSKKNIGFLENSFEVSRYEQQLYKKQLKKDTKLAQTYGLDYTDIVVNVKQKDFQKVFNRLRKMDLTLDNKDRRYIDNFKRAWKKRFGEDLKVKITKGVLEELIKNPNFDLHHVSDPYLDDEDLREEIEKALEEAMENDKEKRKNKKNKQVENN